MVAGEWEFKKTGLAFKVLGWLWFDKLVIHRTLILAIKLLTNGRWVVDRYSLESTEVGKQSFAARVKRI